MNEDEFYDAFCDSVFESMHSEEPPMSEKEERAWLDKFCEKETLVEWLEEQASWFDFQELVTA